MNLNLEGKACLVTGGSSGIGRATARFLLEEGASVAIVARRPELLAATVSELEGLGPIVGFPVDIADGAAVAEVTARARAHFGRLDVMVANAGITGNHANLLDMPESEFAEVIATNVAGTYASCRAAGRVMRQDGVRGRIVLVSSASSYVAEPRLGPYTVSKAAVEGLTRALAVDLAPFGIGVNCVAPGLIDTEGSASWLTDRVGIGLLDRVGQAREIAAAISFLASDTCTFATGTVLLIDGGQRIVGADGPR